MKSCLTRSCVSIVLPFSYVPGQPLADYELVFDRAQGNLKSFEVAQGAYRFRESQCFLQERGQAPMHQLP